MNSKLNSMKTILLTLFALITLTIHAQLNSCCSHQQHCTNQNNHYDSYDNSYFTDLRQALLNPEKVKTLDLRNQNLTRLPWEVRKMQNLEVLLLSNNQLKSLPWEIRYLKQLRKLEIGEHTSELQSRPHLVCRLLLE